MAIFFLSILLLFLAISLVVFFSVYRFNWSGNDPRLPPGSMGWPLFGETLEFFRSGRNGTPETFLHKRMSKYSASVFKTSLLTIKTAVFCGPAGNKFLFSNENKLVNVWWPPAFQYLFPSSLANSVGDEAQRLRQMLMTFLKPEALKRYVGTIDAVAQRHLQVEWEGKGEVKVFPLSKMYAFSLGCRLFGSIEDEDCLRRLQHEFEHLLKGVVSLPLNFPGTSYRRAKRAADAIKNELKYIIERKRADLEQKAAKHAQDMLSHMLVAVDEQGRFMTESEVLDNILVLLLAGRDTTSCATTVLMKHLAEMPEVYQGVLRGKGWQGWILTFHQWLLSGHWNFSFMGCLDSLEEIKYEEEPPPLLHMRIQLS